MRSPINAIVSLFSELAKRIRTIWIHTIKNSRVFRWLSQQPWWKTTLWAVAGLAFISLLGLALLVLLVRAGSFGSLPSYAELSNITQDQASEIYDHNGALLGKYYVENRIEADSSEIPLHLIQALIATEDARFFEHSGIDLKSLGRVLVKSILLSDESSGGGSTISQQLAKNLFPRHQYYFAGIVVNKIREMIIARRLEKTYSKSQIIRLYLNTVPFGGNAYGVKVAAERFFSKRLESLDIHEAALLVGMLKATNSYNPVKYPDRALQRRNVVISQMVRAGYVDSLSLVKLRDQDLSINYQEESHNLGIATYFREHLRQELEEILAGLPGDAGRNYHLYRDGLKIYTTIDATLQRYAEESLRKQLSRLQEVFTREWRGQQPWLNPDLESSLIERSARYRAFEASGLDKTEIEEAFNEPVPMTIFDWNEGEKEIEMSPRDSIRYYLQLLRAGMLVAEPKSGAIKAWVGGVDHRFIQYDHVKSRRQIGSLMKPIVFTAALRDGLHPCTYTENSLVSYAAYEDWEPQNSDGAYGGFYSMEGALTHSVNTVTVDLALKTGLEKIQMLSKDLGISGDVPLEPAIALGAVEASLWEMIQIYGTFANGGQSPDLNFLEEIRTADGRSIWKRGAHPENQVVTSEEAAIMTHFMQSVVDSGTARKIRYHYGIRGEVAGKTGTTQDQSDGWFVGYSPHLVAGVWVGAELPSIHFRTLKTGQGANTALPIWGSFMSEVQGNKSTRHYLQGSFSSSEGGMLDSLDCPHYLPELPEIFDSTEHYAQLLQFGQAVGDLDPEQLKEIMRSSPRRKSESISEYSRRIRDHNRKVLQRRERKKKRKEFFDKLLGRRKN